MYVITPGAYPVQEQQTGGSVWREQSRELYNYLRRDMRDATAERKRLYPVNWSQHVLRTVPFVWAISRELATAYMQSPSRRFVDLSGNPLPDDLVALIEAEYARSHVDEVMRSAHRQLVALNNATIWAWPSAETGGVRLTLIAPHEQEVELRYPFAMHEDDVRMWRWRIAMPVRTAPSTSVYAVGVVTHETAVWEATGELNGQGIYAEDGSMPYDTLPVVMLRGTPPGPGEWWAPVPHDILDAQRAMNHDLTDVGNIARLQGYGQPYVRGYSSGETRDMQLGPETVIGLTGDTAEFGFASANPALDGYVTQVREYVQTVVGMNGMNPATFLKSAGITALAKQVELIDRENYRQEFLGILQAAEQRLYDVMRAVINHQRGAELWPEAIVQVDYRQPIVPADPLHDAQALQMLVDLGQTGRVRARAQRDGVSLEEAYRRMEQDRELDAAAMAQEPPENSGLTMAEEAAVEGESVAMEAEEEALEEAAGELPDEMMS
jgi:hypothetical protein